MRAQEKQTVVRNGYHPERAIQTGLGDLPVKIPKMRDRTGSGLKFNRTLIPAYLKRTQRIEEFLPWLYLRGISTGDCSESLKHLLGTDAARLSAGTIGRLKQGWEQDDQDWNTEVDIVNQQRAGKSPYLTEHQRGLTIPPKLAVGDGAMGFLESLGANLASDDATAMLGA